MIGREPMSVGRAAPVRYGRVVFPRMTNWLPADEIDALRRQISLNSSRSASLLYAA